MNEPYAIIPDAIRAVYSHFHKHFAEFTDDELLIMVRRRLEEWSLPDTATWDDTPLLRGADVLRRDHIHRLARLVVHVEKMGPRQVLQLRGLTGEVSETEATSVALRDLTGQGMITLDVLGSQRIDLLDISWLSGTPVEVLGITFALPTAMKGPRDNRRIDEGRRDFRLHVVGVRGTTSMLDRIGATTVERDEARAHIDRLGAGERLLADIFDLCQTVVGIAGLDKQHYLRDMIGFAVLQALSHGRLGQSSARLHGLLVGPPGAGKGLPGKVAALLNPVTVELPAARMSGPGLVGTRQGGQGGQALTFHPGSLPRASDGVCVLQDAHTCNRRFIEAEFAPIASACMQEGYVYSSMAGSEARMVSLTGLLIDANRSAQTGLVSGQAPDAPFLVHRPLQSRLDAIIEIPADVSRSIDVAVAIAQAESRDPQEVERKARLAKVMVALLRDKNPEVDLSAVRSSIEEIILKLRRQHSEFMDLEEAGDVPVRLVHSLRRYATATARGSNRNYAVPNDLNLARCFLQYKMKFLSKAALAAPKVVRPQQRRQKLLTEHIRAVGSLSRAGGVQLLAQKHGITVDEKTVSRDYNVIGVVDLGGRRYGFKSLGTPGSGTPAEGEGD